MYFKAIIPHLECCTAIVFATTTSNGNAHDLNSLRKESQTIEKHIDNDKMLLTVKNDHKNRGFHIKKSLWNLVLIIFGTNKKLANQHCKVLNTEFSIKQKRNIRKD